MLTRLLSLFPLRQLFLFCLLATSFQAAAQDFTLGYFIGDTHTQGMTEAYRQLLNEHPELGERFTLMMTSQSTVNDMDPASLTQLDLLVLSTHEQTSVDQFNLQHDMDLIAATRRNGLVYGVGEGVFPEDHYTEQGVIWDQQLRAYFHHGGAGNMLAMLKYTLRELGVEGLEIPPPQPSLNFGFYYPTESGGQVFASWEDFDAWRQDHGKPRPGAPRIAVSFYGSYYYSGNTGVIDAVIREVEARGAEAIPLFGYPDEVAFETLLLDAAGKPRVDAALAFSFRFAQPTTGETLGKLDIPVISLINLYGRSAEEWRESRIGLTSFEGTFQVATPELGGLVAPTVVGSLEKEVDPITGLTVVANKPIADRVGLAVQRALKYVALRATTNADKKIAILYYNYPPGKANIGASYLNVPQSLVALLHQLRDSGYLVEGDIPDTDTLVIRLTTEAYNVASYAPGELTAMLEAGNAARVSQADYGAWLYAMDPNLRAKVFEDWGLPEEAELMTVAGPSGPDFVIPMLDFGNVILLPQPVRGWGEDHEKLYHAKDLAPHHQYIATYQWLRKGFQADAVVHLGTHGTLEWLDGKDTGLSSADAPDALIADLPNIYIYNVDVVGEGLVSRRRGAAALVDHMTPPFEKGGIYGELADLNELIKDYQVNEGKNPELTAIYAGQIRDSAMQLGLGKPLGLDLASLESLDTDQVALIQDHLLELQSQNIPYGLHTFGRLPAAAQIDSTVEAIVSADRSLLPEKAQVFAGDMKQRILDSAGRELASFNRGLAGGYLPGGNGGEPIRSPDAYPTGKNFFGIDPDKVPKKASWDLGVKLADQMLADHLEKNGRYPRKISFVIWGGETMRHEGVLESQILHLLGTRPVWNARDKVVDIEVIPSSQLRRPRVDIVIASAAEGMFSNITILMDKAVQQVKLLEEAENYVREHYLDTRAALIAKGYDEQQAERMAGVRIFDEPPGIYNLNTARIVEASGTWDSDIGIANDYIKKMGHGFGNGFWGEPMEDAFRLALSGTEKVVHSNSTSLYGALDNDDFYMYMGGLATAVRSLDGASPELLVTNTRNPAQPEMTAIDKFIGLEFRSRYVNPTWIEGMMAEGYAGAGEMVKFVEYLWGWDATVTEVVDDAMWQEAFEVYIEDKHDMALAEFFAEKSPYAMQEISSRMLETIRKGYWEADAATERALLETWLENVAVHGAGCSDHTCGNPRLLEHTVQRAQALELNAPLIDNFQQSYEAAIGASINNLARLAEDFVARNEARLERRQDIASNGVAPREVAGFAMERVERSQSGENAIQSVSATNRSAEFWLSVVILLALLGWRWVRRTTAYH